MCVYGNDITGRRSDLAGMAIQENRVFVVHRVRTALLICSISSQQAALKVPNVPTSPCCNL